MSESLWDFLHRLPYEYVASLVALYFIIDAEKSGFQLLRDQTVISLAFLLFCVTIDAGILFLVEPRVKKLRRKRKPSVTA